MPEAILKLKTRFGTYVREQTFLKDATSATAQKVAVLLMNYSMRWTGS